MSSGVYNVFHQDLKKPIQERYIHSITTTPNGGTLIFTFQYDLIAHIHLAYGLYIDTTFKRAIGHLKEVEIVMWLPSVNRGRSYIVLPKVMTHYCTSGYYWSDLFWSCRSCTVQGFVRRTPAPCTYSYGKTPSFQTVVQRWNTACA